MILPYFTPLALFLHLDTPKIRIGWTNAKTPESVRTVPVFSRATAAASILAGDRASGLLIRYKYDTLGRYIKRVCEAVFPDRGVTAHWMRYSFISWFVNDLSLPIKTASMLAGHTDANTTLGYVHVSGSKLEDAIRRAQGLPLNDPPSVVADWLSSLP